MPGRGRGLVAAAPIPRGTRILVEEPLLKLSAASDAANQLLYLRLTAGVFDDPAVVSRREEVSKSLRTFLDAELAAMSDDDRMQVLGLSDWRFDKGLTEQQSSVGLLLTNCIVAGSSGAGATSSGGEAGVFPTISRINHSCVPNAGFVVKASEQASSSSSERERIEVIVLAYRDIAQGEEICVAYKVGRSSCPRTNLDVVNHHDPTKRTTYCSRKKFSSEFQQIMPQ